MRKIMSIVALGVALMAGPARAIDVPDVYRGQAIVTGTQEPERSRGMRLALMDVLVKVSGDARLLADRTLQPVLNRAAEYAVSFDYEDRKKGMKINDEQGTRDRPHDLRVQFDKAKIDALLAERGLKPWRAQRPQLLMLVAVRYPDTGYPMTADGQFGFAQRLALTDASTRRGVPTLLPTTAALADAKLTIDRIATLTPEDMTGLTARLGGEAPLRGVMVLDDKMPGWRSDWTLIENGRIHRWHSDSPSFDEAFRQVVQHSAGIFAGLHD